MEPPTSVPFELAVKPPPSQMPLTCLFDTSCAIGATLMVPLAVHTVWVLPRPVRFRVSVCELPEHRCARPGLLEARSMVFDSGPKEAPARTVVPNSRKTSWLTPRLPLPAFQLQRSRVRPVPA